MRFFILVVLLYEIEIVGDSAEDCRFAMYK